MGVKQLWSEVDYARRYTSLEEEAWKAFEHSPYRALRLGIDASLWMFHSTTAFAKKTEYTGTNPELRTIFYRIANLLSLPILPIFIFDGSERPKLKRGRVVHGGVPGTAFNLAKSFKHLLDAFGFQYWDAPGEAEAELGWLNDYGLVDAIWTDDADSLVFGAKKVIRNSSSTLSGVKANSKRDAAAPSSSGSRPARQKSASKDLKSVDMAVYVVKESDAGKKALRSTSLGYLASESESGLSDGPGDDSDEEEDEEGDLGEELLRLPMDRWELALFACLTGGDYDIQGVYRCGAMVAKALALLGFGKRVVLALKQSLADGPTSVPEYNWHTWMPEVKLDERKWRSKRAEIVEDMCEELRTNASGVLGRKQPAIAKSFNESFLATKQSLSVLASYIWPRTTLHRMLEGSDTKGIVLKWPHMGTVTFTDESIRSMNLSPRTVKESRERAGFDLLAVIIDMRRIFAYDDVMIRAKLQGTIYDGVMVRKLCAEALEGMQHKGNQNEAVTPARMRELYALRIDADLGKASPSQSSLQYDPLPSPSKLARANAHNTDSAIGGPDDKLFKLEEMTLLKTVNGRTLYRIKMQDKGLDELVQHILLKLNMPIPPPSPRKLQAAARATEGSTLERLDHADSSPPKKTVKPAEYKEEARPLWMAAEMIDRVPHGRRLLAEWEEKKANRSSPQKRTKKPSQGTSSSRTQSSSSTSSYRQTRLEESMSLSSSPTKSVLKAKAAGKKSLAGISDSSEVESEEETLVPGRRDKGKHRELQESAPVGPSRVRPSPLTRRPALPSKTMAPAGTEPDAISIISDSDSDEEMVPSKRAAAHRRKLKVSPFMRTTSNSSTASKRNYASESAASEGDDTFTEKTPRANRACEDKPIVVVDDSPNPTPLSTPDTAATSVGQRESSQSANGKDTRPRKMLKKPILPNKPRTPVQHDLVDLT